MATIVNSVYSYLVTLWCQPHWWAEAWSSFVLVSWSLTFIFGSATDNPSYTALVNSAPVLFWDIAGLIAGSLQLAGLLLDNRWLRAFTAFVSSYLFTYLMLSFTSQNHFYPSLSVYGGFVGINIMAMYKQIRPSK